MIKNGILPKNLIFDFDHTIIDLLIDWDKGIEVLLDLLQKVNKKLYDRFAYLDINQLINKFYRYEGDDFRHTFIEFTKNFEKNNLISHNADFGLINKIKSLKNEYYLYIWSSNTKGIILPLLEKYMLKDVFKKIVAIEDVKFIKPSGSGFNNIYDKKFPYKSEYLMVGDSSNDKDCAKDAGIAFIYVKEFMLY